MAVELLIETGLASSAAMLLVLAARKPVRARFGAGIAYALWLLVPASLLAVLLPAGEPVLPALVPALPGAASAGFAAAAATAAAGDVSILVPALWACGVVAMLGWLLHQQRRFVQGLGPLHRRPDGHLQSLATRGLPAVIGLRPRIVLPGDFEQRYGAIERELVLAHEQAHLRRGDLPACALAALLRALFWFNPLAHVAAARFRHDQELACDAAVLGRFPSHRRHYGDAMLKTRLADQPLPLGCHWFGSHPMKERLAMLKNPLPSRRRRIAGFALVALLGLCTAALAWATQPGGVAAVPPGKLQMELDIRLDGHAARSARVVLSPGEAHEENFEHAGQAWATTWTVRPLPDGTFDVQASLRRDGELVGEPRLIAKDSAAIGIGEEDAAGKFTGIQVEMRLALGPPAPGMAAVGIAGGVPAYPAAAVKAGEGGVVMLKLLVGTDGRVRELAFVPEKSSLPAESELVRSTLETAASWTLEPVMQDGKPVEDWVMVPVRFEPPADTPAGG